VYRVIDIDGYVVEDLEASGARGKFWFQNGSDFWLFKYARNRDTREYLMEKVAYELCKPLSLPHAYVELAVRNGRVGSMSRSVMSNLNNVILTEFRELVKTEFGWSSEASRYWYERSDARYNVKLIEETVVKIEPSIVEYFIRAMLFDFLIVNRDRHHSNWGILENPLGGAVFCPLYDSGSGLFSTKPEESIEKMIRDGNLVELALNAQSKVNVDNKAPTQFKKLLRYLISEYKGICTRFITEIGVVWTDDYLREVVGELGTLATVGRKEFMYRLLRENRDYLLREVGLIK